AWTTSWGVSTRLIGTLIMAHGDDNGLVLPPRIAPAHAVIIPITPKQETRAAVLETVDKLAASLREVRYHETSIGVEVDLRDLGGGVKSWEWIKKGIPLRIEIGPRDLAQGTVALSRRDKTHKEKSFVPMADLPGQLATILDDIQAGMLARATAFRDQNTQIINTKAEFYDFFTQKDPATPEPNGGFALAHWNGNSELESQIKDDLKVTIRCIPLDKTSPAGRCIFTDRPSLQRAIWAKSY
ncbi:MAG TPA: His/Gly/Thr/Pro-type tRNA ligase C-terminal domain-containing protein, partial [Terrimicrobiaceae bacterium]